MNEESPSGPKSLSLDVGDLEFQQPRSRARKAVHRNALLSGTIMAAAVLLSVAVVASLFTRSSSGSGYVVAVLVVLVALGMALAISVRAMRWRYVTIASGTLSLESPIRRNNGVRARSVQLSEVIDVEPMVSDNGFNGAMVTLSDGTKFFLAQSSFGDRGLEILERFCTAFGRSYQDGLKEILLRSNQFGFRIAKPSGVMGDAIVLAKGMRTYSGTETRRIRFQDIRELEHVSTTYAGHAYLVTLSDGTRFLMRDEDVEAVDLSGISGWSDKAREI